MEPKELFSILDSVDSTNNYAMARVHEGLAKPGEAWFSSVQTSGKGQRDKEWYSRPGENIALSLVLQPGSLLQGKLFVFNSFIALECCHFLSSYYGEELKIKWPNDVYWQDRKAGGILIENIIQAGKWNWTVAGIGINVNSENFPVALPNPVSLKQVTGKSQNVTSMARALHQQILGAFDKLDENKLDDIMNKYNTALYKKNERVRLRKNNQVFATIIKDVNQYGQLITMDVIERKFEFGEVEWVRD